MLRKIGLLLLTLSLVFMVGFAHKPGLKSNPPKNIQMKKLKPICC